jgi:hypothetical protein
VLDAERDIGARLALQLVRERHLVGEDDHLAIGCEASDRPGDVAAAYWSIEVIGSSKTTGYRRQDLHLRQD